MRTKHLIWKAICIKITSFLLFSYTKTWTSKATTFNWKLQPAFHTTKIYAQYSLANDPSKKTENNPAVSICVFIFEFACNNHMSISEGYKKIIIVQHSSLSVCLFCMPFSIRFKLHQRNQETLIHYSCSFFFFKLLNKLRRIKAYMCKL